MNVYERLLQPENLNYAWLKARKLFWNADGYVDVGELAAFELDLEQRLQEIRQQFVRGKYRLTKLRPLPRPKKLSGDVPVNRQYYHVAVDDQVAWIAVANALGPELDKLMPAWSYGNRLYRPAWYEKDEERRSTLEIGPYRHASGNLYRKFQHSWPLSRRHITLTARIMAERRPLRSNEMDEVDQLAVASAERDELVYFEAGFWPPRKGKSTNNDLYHASIDLKQFYPTLDIGAIQTGLGRAGATEDPRIASLVADMLRFRIELADMPASALEKVEPPFLKQSIKGIPTGLFVAGFLANVAMLPVDTLIARRIAEQRSVAHFRFVDDHTFIADDFDALCDWIAWYEHVLVQCGIGARINTDKYDPPSLGEWMAIREAASETVPRRSRRKIDLHSKKRDAAVRDTRIDGKNPTQLMTKTLAQVSAIAATNIHILDDEDLEERLKMLEWLLLADIPEREIRPDTRAAFAAGQIASLAPLLIQEADGLVQTARAIARLKGLKPHPERSTAEERERYEKILAQHNQQLEDCLLRHEQGETALLSRCFSLLLQALREHPGKARLFYRIHQYCRRTGYAGLLQIADWLQEMRAVGRHAWADYYAGLSLQIMARGVLAAAHRIDAREALRSDVKAALDHLQQVARLPVEAFRVEPGRETWFHSMGRREFGVALLQVAEILSAHPDRASLAGELRLLARHQVAVGCDAPAEVWRAATGHTLGIWLHLAENILGDEDAPSLAWHAFSPHLVFSERMDALAARRYPEWLPQAGWKQLLASAEPLPESDSGWLREIIAKDEAKRAAAFGASRNAFARAARSLETPPPNWMTIEEWTTSVHLCNPFDPRRSEWTALEITSQLLERAISFEGEEEVLDRLHPNNVLLPRIWVTDHACARERTELSWETWRQLARSKENGQAKLREPSTSLVDYRYAVESKAGILLPDSERRLVAIGRLLLGLLRNNHAAPRIWNLRGNELIFHLPRARWFEALAISSPTTLIIEACLGARPAESRSIARSPLLFGWRNGEVPNDTDFDPPAIVGPSDLVALVRRAQEVLEHNQLAVAMNQPRQLIPFRLRDFGTASDIEVGEGDDDAE